MPDLHPDDARPNAVFATKPEPGDTLAALKALHDTLRRCLDHLRRTGGPVPQELRARLAACEADLMEAQVDNMPV